MRMDTRRSKAATYIQRRWKRNHGKALDIPGKSGLSAARSKFVHAPAYLGESCLWAPLEEWDHHSQPYLYAARCESRGEFCYLSRSSIKNIIDRFSPWLAQRYEYYRQTVHDNL